MSLLDHAIWWHVYPLGALGAPIREQHDQGVVHRLPNLDPWLDYAVGLGCSGLLLGPVFASVSHGYDTLDHFRIDPRLGDDADFDHLIAETRARGLSVMLDGVFNHVAAAHPLVGEGLARGAWEGHDALATLDHSDPRVADLVTDVMLHWLRRGIAGWRLDVAYAVPADFWRTVLGRVRAEFPQAVFLGEVLHGDYAAFAKDSTLDTVTQYELWKATWSSLQDRNFWELAWALERHDAIAGQMIPQTFVGNHDVSRIATLVGDSGAALALLILMTLPGSPSIYYGDEQAFRGAKETGFHADDSLRPPLPASPDDLVPYGWWMYRLHQDLVGLRRRNPWLTRGHVRVIGKDCPWIIYEVTGEGHSATVELHLDPVASSRVVIDGALVFSWPRA